MANNYNGVPRPPVIFCPDGDARVVVRRESFEELLAPRCPLTLGRLRVGLLGHGTVGGAFASCSRSAPTRSSASTAAGPRSAAC